MSSAPCSQRPRRPGSADVGDPEDAADDDGAGDRDARPPGLLDSQRDVAAPRASRARQPASTTSAEQQDRQDQLGRRVDVDSREPHGPLFRISFFD